MKERKLTETEKMLRKEIIRLEEEKDLLKKRMEKLRKIYIKTCAVNEELSDKIKDMEELRDFERRAGRWKETLNARADHSW